MLKRLSSMAARVCNRQALAKLAVVPVVLGGVVSAQTGPTPATMGEVFFVVDPDSIATELGHAVGVMLLAVVPTVIGIMLIKTAIRWLMRPAR